MHQLADSLKSVILTQFGMRETTITMTHFLRLLKNNSFWSHCSAFDIVFVDTNMSFVGINLIIVRSFLWWFLVIKPTEVVTLYFEFPSQFLGRYWAIILIVQSLFLIIDIYSLKFFIYGLSAQFIPLAGSRA